MDECDEVAVWLLTGVQACWRCGDSSGVMLGVDVAGVGVVDAGEDLCEQLAGAEWVPVCERLGLGVLKPRWSKTAGRSYWSQGCGTAMRFLVSGRFVRRSTRPLANAGTASDGVGPISLPIWIVAPWEAV